MLHLAVLLGLVRLTRFLIEHGIDLDAQDYHGFTALHFAAWTGNHKIVDLLIEGKHLECVVSISVIQPRILTFPPFSLAGAAIDQTNSNDQLASDLALLRGHNAIATQLRRQMSLLSSSLDGDDVSDASDISFDSSVVSDVLDTASTDQTVPNRASHHQDESELSEQAATSDKPDDNVPEIDELHDEDTDDEEIVAPAVPVPNAQDVNTSPNEAIARPTLFASISERTREVTNYVSNLIQNDWLSFDPPPPYSASETVSDEKAYYKDAQSVAKASADGTEPTSNWFMRLKEVVKPASPSGDTKSSEGPKMSMSAFNGVATAFEQIQVWQARMSWPQLPAIGPKSSPEASKVPEPATATTTTTETTPYAPAHAQRSRPSGVTPGSSSITPTTNLAITMGPVTASANPLAHALRIDHETTSMYPGLVGEEQIEENHLRNLEIERRRRHARDRVLFLFWIPMILLLFALALCRFIATDEALQERVLSFTRLFGLNWTP
jgi:hypothetical protein